MVTYNFKKITVVPNASDFVNIVLSRTQRKTPTVVHPQYQISRIRKFYMRKIKYTQATIHEKLSMVLDDFPRLEDIHPFYANLMNVLYDKDHYKLALGQLHTARNIVDGIGRDYLRLLKFSDSAYRCKQLKRAALGRMVTVLKKQNGAFSYLEQVRQHMARLPTIDPTTRTLILTGYPNVGKSSFMNNVTRADVEVQPYPFTTKSLFVGHTDYKYLRWQVLDTPGILDHPLEDRNTIEMQSITALAHLKACVLYMLDMSEYCGYSIKQQVSLFHNIRPLFTGKPVLLVLTKCDLIRPEKLTPENKELLESITKEGIEAVIMSNITEEGIADVKAKACDTLLQHRVEAKLGKGGKKMDDVLSKIFLATPMKRDNKDRPVFIPESVQMEQSGEAMKQEKKLEIDYEREAGGSGAYDPDYKKNYKLSNEEWKYDIIPELMDGKNIADFVDPEILKRLDELEKEEEELLAKGEGNIDYGADEFFVSKEQEAISDKIDSKIRVYKKKHLLKKHDGPVLPRKHKKINIDEVAKELMDRGVDEETLEKARSRSLSVSRARSKAKRSVSISRTRSISQARQLDEAQSKPAPEILGKRSRSISRNRSLSTSDRLSGIKDPNMQLKALDIASKKMKFLRLDARRGESDRHVYSNKPKHLFTGTMSFQRDHR